MWIGARGPVGAMRNCSIGSGADAPLPARGFESLPLRKISGRRQRVRCLGASRTRQVEIGRERLALSAASWLEWVGRDDQKKVRHFVRFDNYLPRTGSKPGFYDETVINYVGAKAHCAPASGADRPSVKVERDPH